MDTIDNEQPCEPQPQPQPQPCPPPPSWTPPPPVQNKRNYTIPIALLVGCLPWLILFMLTIIAIIGTVIGMSGPSESDEHIALIRVEGEIQTVREGSGLMPSGSALSGTVISLLEEARQDDNAKGVLLRIDTPGGSPAASEEIYNEINRVRKEGKPVYVTMGDIATSGGYYISSAADRIYADSNTLTGSIGVIWRTADMSKLYKMIGYTPNVIKAGKYKDINNPSRPMTAEERQFIQRLVDNTYDEFISAVAAGRKKSVSQIRKIAEGRIYDGKQAKKLGLVDEIGGFEQAKIALAKRCGLDPDDAVIEYGRTGILQELFMGSETTSEKFGASFMRGAMKTLTEENRGDLR